MSQSDVTMTDEDDLDPDPANLRGKLNEALKRARAAETQVAEAESLRKENAFLKAELPETAVTKLYRDTYTGDLSVDAIKAGAIELEIIPKVDQATQAEMDTLENQSQAVNGSTPSMAPNDVESMMKEFEAEVKAGRSGEPILRKYGHTVASDER